MHRGDSSRSGSARSAACVPTAPIASTRTMPPRAAYAISDIVRRAYRCGTKSDEEGWHPSKRLKLLVGGKCTADSRHPDPLSRGDEEGMSR